MGVSHQSPPATRSQPPATSMATKESKPKAPATHPKYIDMITAAIPALKDRMGSVRLALKAGVAKGVIKTAKEAGKGAGKFKVVKAEKPKKPAVKKPAAKKPDAKKVAVKKP